MSSRFIITGTDTDVGKTIFSAALMLALEEAGKRPYYWKPLQSGVVEGVDTRTVQDVTNLPEERFLPEKYIFSEALSPHRAAEIDGVEIDVDALKDVSVIPNVDGTLIIEGAGGMMVPISRKNLLINVFKKWKTPVILVSRTELGTINHTLLSLEALWARRIPVHGIAFVGDYNPDNICTISQFSKVKILGRLPLLEDVNAAALRSAFAEHFNIKDFCLLSRAANISSVSDNDEMQQVKFAEGS